MLALAQGGAAGEAQDGSALILAYEGDVAIAFKKGVLDLSRFGVSVGP